ncbi:hypothetical protein [Sporomusa sphaeroides]|uniref:HTH merR-type domain-containing protein n=1 Tax=Sporomusa sphaeroides DSM 2875 TaxID=1337886 RepID=A0ABM9VXJ2_9FIRM|nr:hypothetical protein [Sporomusa sphaeroides]OLS58261.1 hypothetical protein SPSPH_17970 [Sporomusa sphaeroides DSM 2875]CVK17552.1 hypothetical protein SSPH_00186 [Sporomusa sphaeroides DSM 2875]
MSPDELIYRLQKIEVTLSRTTLNRYERDGLIATPKRGGYGRGGGRWTEYPTGTIIEVATAWAMLGGNTFASPDGQKLRFSPNIVGFARREAIQEISDFIPPASFLFGLLPSDIMDTKTERIAREKELFEKYEEYKKSQEYQDSLLNAGDESEKLVRYEYSLRGITIPDYLPATLLNCNYGKITSAFQKLAVAIYLDTYLTFFMRLDKCKAL